MRVFIISYPRSGNTWMRFLVANLLFPDREIRGKEIAEIVPDICQPDGLQALNGEARFFKSHLKTHIAHRDAKFVYLYRDGRDVAVSYYEAQSWADGGRFANASWREFFECYLRGDTAFGAWDEHVRYWMFYETRPHLMALSYEALIKDTAGQLGRVAQFCDITAVITDLEKAVSRSDYSVLKQIAGAEGVPPLGRNAQSGTWRQYFDEEDERKFWNRFGETMTWLGYER